MQCLHKHFSELTEYMKAAEKIKLDGLKGGRKYEAINDIRITIIYTVR